MNNFKSGMTAGLSQRSTKRPSQAKECAVAIRSFRKKDYLPIKMSRFLYA